MCPEGGAVVRAILCLVVVLSTRDVVICADKSAATVNGEAIAISEVEALIAQSSTKKPTPAEAKQQRADVVQLLVDDRLIRQFLRQNGPKIEDADVDRQYAALVSSQKSMGKSIEDYLKEVGLSAAKVKVNFRQMLQLHRYLEAQATDERLQKYYSLTRDFFDGTTVKVSHIVIRISESTSAEDRQKAMAKLRWLRDQVLAGTVEFSSAAKAHSQCPSAAMGGDLGFVARKFQIDEAIARSAFAMKPNELSEVIVSEVGYHLVLVTDRKVGKPSKFDAVRDDVRECFETDLKQALLADLRKKAKIEILLKD
jgi:parvulin-like peptidyl-prolyl isomerase